MGGKQIKGGRKKNDNFWLLVHQSRCCCLLGKVMCSSYVDFHEIRSGPNLYSAIQRRSCDESLALGETALAVYNQLGAEHFRKLRLVHIVVGLDDRWRGTWCDTNLFFLWKQQFKQHPAHRLKATKCFGLFWCSLLRLAWGISRGGIKIRPSGATSLCCKHHENDKIIYSHQTECTWTSYSHNFMSSFIVLFVPFIFGASAKRRVSRGNKCHQSCFLASDREKISIFLFCLLPSNCYINNLAGLILLRSTIVETKCQFHSYSNIQKATGWYKLISSRHIHMGDFKNGP